MFIKKITTLTKQQLLFSTHVEQTNAIAKLKKYFEENKNSKKTQLDRYIGHNAPPEILKLVKLHGGPALGTECEKIAKYYFDILKCRSSSDYDHLINLNGKIIKVEQKSSTVIKKSSTIEHPSDFLWQHIEPHNSWDILLFCAIDYDGIKFYMMTKNKFNILLMQKKIVKQGGKNSYQGYWTKYSKIKKSIVQINNSEDIQNFIKMLINFD